MSQKQLSSAINNSSGLLIERVPIRALRPNPRNARTHSARQIRLLKESIQTFGQIKPVIIDDNNTILAGHGFLEAARLAGLSRIAVLRFSHLTETQKRAYLLADNKIAEEAGWDREMLAIELGELADLLPAEGFDVSLTGFQTPEIDLLLADMAPSRPTPADAIPALPKAAVARRGDLWALGKHRLLCGDAQELTDLNRLMDGMSAAAVFCDPPYNQPARSIGSRGRTKHSDFAFASGEMSTPQFKKFLAQTLGNGVFVSAEGAVHFVCMDWRHIAELIEIGRDLYGAMLNLVVWNKSNAGQGSFYRSQHELVGVFRVGDQSHQNNVELGRFGRNRSNVWNYAGINTFGANRMETLALHPTVKPVTLVADALLDCTNRGDAVLDQFCGSGTLILAAEKIGRIAYGLEYEPGYIDVAIQRWQNVTKLQAILDEDGRTFEEMAKSRARSDAANEPARSSMAIDKSQLKASKNQRKAVRSLRKTISGTVSGRRHG